MFLDYGCLEKIRLGQGDDDSFVEAFAQHRQSTQADLIRALEEIDRMPLYSEPVPAEWVSGLVARYNKAVNLATQAIALYNGDGK